MNDVVGEELTLAKGKCRAEIVVSKIDSRLVPTKTLIEKCRSEGARKGITSCASVSPSTSDCSSEDDLQTRMGTKERRKKRPCPTATIKPALGSSILNGMQFQGKPSEFLERLLSQRGYGVAKWSALPELFSVGPQDELLKTCYSFDFINAIKSNNVKMVKSMLESGVGHVDAKNKYGHSVLHCACRHGFISIIQLLVKGGATCLMSDECGKTPLHDACWSMSPDFEMFKSILVYKRENLSLLRAKDRLNATPLDYVRPENHKKWCDFLWNQRDVFWPLYETKHGNCRLEVR